MTRHSLSLTRTAAPAWALLGLADVKGHLRITDTAEDAQLQELIDVAAEQIDGPSSIVGRALLTQSWRLQLNEWPCDSIIRLPLPPLQSVTSITYVDEAGATQTVDPADYQVSIPGDLPATIRPAYGKAWPAARCVADAIAVDFVCGYGSPADVPAVARQACRVMVAHWHENRDAIGTMPTAAEYLLRHIALPEGMFA